MALSERCGASSRHSAVRRRLCTPAQEGHHGCRRSSRGQPPYLCCTAEKRDIFGQQLASGIGSHEGTIPNILGVSRAQRRAGALLQVGIGLHLHHVQQAPACTAAQSSLKQRGPLLAWPLYPPPCPAARGWSRQEEGCGFISPVVAKPHPCLPLRNIQRHEHSLLQVAAGRQAGRRAGGHADGWGRQSDAQCLARQGTRRRSAPSSWQRHHAYHTHEELAKPGPNGEGLGSPVSV